MIEALDPNSIQVFHINDAEDLPRAELERQTPSVSRPRDSAAARNVGAFRRIGYDKVASVEIFRPEYWERDPFELAHKRKSTESRRNEPNKRER